ncbi:ATP-dependent RNA helicase [Trachipleistophora hominis]|uniref:ATP-dependent RNA helicase n=1 Tax=Trachipleistophora hominis TaxID=72359 RepID=L7JTQ7_TRAHO|nr:ATP-dependent RNA helicase [Trachipleistophora hominis]
MSGSFDKLKLTGETRARLETISITTPTNIQTDVIRSFNDDLIVESPTGTGKTLAYLIPIVDFYLKNRPKRITALILVPTRELAQQVGSVLASLGVKNTVIIGGTDEELNFEEILVATPGRFNKILLNSRTVICSRTNLSLHTLLKKIDFLVLDEADKLLSLGFRSQLLSITGQIKAKRNALFSATMNDDIASLCRSFLKSPKTIKNHDKIPLDIRYVSVDPFGKLKMLYDVIMRNKKVICFFLTCNEVDYFYSLFTALGVKNIAKIHGKMKQEERNAVYENFKSVLFGTDLASRGIDFLGVDVVVHFDIPLDPESFVHRSGRTGRNNKHGRALLFITDNEKKYLNYLKVKNINISEERVHENNKIDGNMHSLSTDIDDRVSKLENKEVTGKLNNKKKIDQQEMAIEHKQMKKNKLLGLDNGMELDVPLDEDVCKKENECNNNITIDDNQKEGLLNSENLQKSVFDDFDAMKKHLTDEILKLSVKAFVAHVCAYKEHKLRFLLDFKELNFDSLAKLHFLMKIPKMKELRGVKFEHYDNKQGLD